MSNMHKVLLLLDQDKKGRRHIVEIKSAAFDAVGLIHREDQGEDIDVAELDRRLNVLEDALERAKKFSPEIANNVPASIRQAALDTVQACVL